MRRIRKHTPQPKSQLTPPSKNVTHDVVVQDEERRGAVLVVVGALLGLLALLGFFFYTFARQENANAEYFAATSKVYEDPGIDPNIFFDWSLKQIIIGGPSYLEHSALFGGRSALVPNMFGRDVHPFSGRGIHLINDNAGLPEVDQNYNNIPDDDAGEPVMGYDGLKDVNRIFLSINDSPAANNGRVAFNGEDLNGNGMLDAGEDVNGNGALDPPYPAPDVDYTAPDINNVYLGYRGFGLNGATPVQVIIPSYHRPQYLRQNVPPVSPIDDWYINANTATAVLRPHPAHSYIPDILGVDGAPGLLGVDDDGDTFPDFEPGLDGQPGMALVDDDGLNGVDDLGELGFFGSDDVVDYDEFGADGSDDAASNGMRRFLDENNANDAAVIASLPLASGGFPFIPKDDLGSFIDLDGDMVYCEMGVWTNSPANIYELDVDADGDGIREAIWMDLDFPIQETEDGAAHFIPLFGVTIYDADALFNLNVHGNADGVVNFDTPAAPFGTNGTNELLSQSNMGVSPAEVNPGWALTADATGADFADLQQLQRMYDPGNTRFDPDMDTFVNAMIWQELSNMEFFNSLVGRPQYQSDTVIEEYYQGRWGEVARLQAAIASRLPGDFPAAGETDVDDNGNLDLGESVGGRPAFFQPIDYRGLGEWFDYATGLGYGKQPLDYTLADTLNRWVRYQGFETRGTVLWGQPQVQIAGVNRNVADGTGSLMQTLSGAPLLPGFATNALIDEAFESNVGFDNLFQASNNAYLQLNDIDIANASITSRLQTLMPYNLSASPDALNIRKRLTTASNDVKPFGRTFYGDNPATLPDNLAGWEYVSFDEDAVLGDDANSFDNAYLPVEINSFNNDLKRFVPSFQDRFIADATVGTFNGEPFRPQLARWLEVVANETDFSPNALRQRLLNLNQVIEHYGLDTLATPPEASWPFGVDGLPGIAGIDDNGLGVDDDGDTTIDDPDEVDEVDELGAKNSDDLIPLRQLTEHVDDPGFDDGMGNVFIGLPQQAHPAPETAFTDPREQEAWARYDRQMLARDIFVMLYTFGGGVDDDYRKDNSGSALYTPAQVREMAQFAINTVNALDRDIVIDAFEYDTNLHDGWNPDDDPYDRPDTTPVGMGGPEELGPDGAAGLVNVDDDGDGHVDFIRPGVIDYKEHGFGDDPVGTVYGVEAQSLTISEALFVRSYQVDDGTMTMTGTDLPVTQHNDSETRHFAFIELRNASPFPVTFDNGATAIGTAGIFDNGCWQLEMTVDDGINPALSRRLTFRTNDPSFGYAPIPAGGLFTIMTDDAPDLDPVDGTTVLPSHFVIDHNFVDGVTTPPDNFDDNILNTIIPAGVSAPGVKPLPGLDLILEHNDITSATDVPFFVDDGAIPDGSTYDTLTKQPGEFFSPITPHQSPTGPMGPVTLPPGIVPDNLAGVTIRLSLRRRAHPGRAAYPETESTTRINNYDFDNPWIEVDSASYQLGDGLVEWLLDKDAHKDGEEVKRQLAQQIVRSRERVQPLNRNQSEDFQEIELVMGSYQDVTPQLNGSEAAGFYSGVGTDSRVRFNTLGGDNGRSLVRNIAFDRWQPHFDRDFASVMELLAVPLYAPENLTDGQDDTSTPMTPLTARGLDQGGLNTAGRRKFLQPDNAFEGTLNTLDPLDNRWYRLLGMVEVPTLVNGAAEIRVPGRINLNTVRDPQVLAGLLDDAALYTLDSANRTLVAADEGTRDYWQQLLRARDGVDDPTVAGAQRGNDPVTGFLLPGLPGAQPFRSFNFAADGLDSLEQTLLRGLPLDLSTGLDASELPSRRLFELGTPNERYGTTGMDELEQVEDQVDFYTRNRLLSKIAGNTTNRSNVFFVFIQVDYFEAVEDQYGPDGQPGVSGMDDDGDTVVDNSSEIGWSNSDECGADMEPGVAGVDDDGDTLVDNVTELGTKGSDDIVAIRIGGKLAESPGHRGFFVIDRSLAFDTLEGGDFRRPSDPSKFSIKAEFEGGFDFRDVITFRQLLN